MSHRFFKAVKSLITDTFKSAQEHDVALHGAAIAFYTIFSTAPLIIIVLALSNIFLSEQHTAHLFVSYLSQITGPDIAQSLLKISQNSARKSSGLIASIIATAVLIFGATTVITQLKNSLNTMWNITRPRISSVVQYAVNRAMALVLIFILTALFLASLILEGGMTFFTGLFLPYLPDIFAPVLQIASSLLSIFITIIFFTLIFKILPDVNARWKDIFVGACVTSILFLIGKYLVGFYLVNTSMYDSYKTAGSFIVYLIWIYYNVQVVLLGAEFTQVYIKRYGKNVQPTWNAELIDLSAD